MRHDLPRQSGPNPDLTLHFLDNSGVLFDAGHRRLYSLNTTATYIWCCLEEGFDRGRIEQGLQQTFGFAPSAAATHVAEILQQWRTLGLLRLPVDGNGTDRPQSDTGASSVAVDVRLLDVTFRLEVSPADLLDDLMLLVEPLATALPSDRLRLQIASDQKGFTIRGPSGSIAHCRRRDQIVPLLKICLVRLALERSRDVCAVHAAGVDLNGKCLLLPGMSGSGKSTLAIALNLAGLSLLGDDTIVLARDTLAARPLSLAVCLKPGTWRLLRQRLPGLAAQPIHVRPDGKRVRYALPSPATRLSPDARRAVGWIVFPQRAGESRTELVPLSRVDALTRLLHECCQLGSGFDADGVARLVRWISDIPCFDLRFSSLDAAVERLHGLSA